MGEALSFKKVQVLLVAAFAAMTLGFAVMGAPAAYADEGLQAGSMLSIQSNVAGTEHEAGSGATAADYTITNTKSQTVSYTESETKSATVKVPATVTINGKKYKVTKIDDGALKGNKAMKKLAVAKNVKVIGKNAFADCPKLYDATLGAGVTKIGAKAFANTPKLKTLVINSKNLKKAGVKSALKGSSVKTVKVPKAKVKAYKKIFTKANCGKKVAVVAA